MPLFPKMTKILEAKERNVNEIIISYTPSQSIKRGGIYYYMPYNNLPKERVMQIYSFVINKRKEENIGQRKLARLVEKEFNINIHENTISNWIYSNKIPFGNEKTQFKSLSKPAKEELHYLYIKEKLSAQRIAQKYKVSTAILINWLRFYNIPIRTHKESMNTSIIKEELSQKKLKKPTKRFNKIIPEKAYIFGVLCGDAHINKMSIRFEIRRDKDFIEEFSKCFEIVYGLKYNYHYYEKRNSYVLYISSKIICSDLLKEGDFRTFVWRIPKDILESKNELIISSFLRGFYDSEGSASKYCISASSSNNEGIKEVSLLLEKLGIKNKIIQTKRKHYVVNITGKERIKLFKERIGFTIKRKMERIEI